MVSNIVAFLVTLVVILVSLISVLLFKAQALLFEKEQRHNQRLTQLSTSKLPLYEASKYSLSIVIPAYNESKRILTMLVDTLEYLKKRTLRDNDFTFEIVIVDDGSRDNTIEVINKFKADNELKEDELKVIHMKRNWGKGAAVTEGVLFAKGAKILFADADGATPFNQLTLLEAEINKVENESLGFAIGSRAHLVNSDAVVKRTMLRNMLMFGFHKYLYVLGIRKVKDTQCGFKLFTRKAAQRIFPNVHITGWIFDIELLLLADMASIPIKEVMVQWQEIDGSKVNVIKDSIKMAVDLLMVRLAYGFRVWKFSKKAEGKL